MLQSERIVAVSEFSTAAYTKGMMLRHESRNES